MTVRSTLTPPHRSRRSWQLVAGLIATFLVLVVAACGSSSDDSSAAKTDLSVGFFPAVIYLPDAVAKEKGYFEDEGLNVKFVTPQDGPTLFRLVMAGKDINLTVTDAGAPISFASQGQKVALVGSVLNKSPWEISVPTNAEWADGRSYEERLLALKGKTIGVPGLGSAGYLTLSAGLRQVGLDPEKDVKVIAVVGLPAVASQFKKGSLDAYVYQLPFAGQLEKEGAGRSYVRFATDGAALIGDVVSGAVMTSSKWLESNKPTVARYLAAQQRAVEWLKDPANSAEAAKIFNTSFLSGKQPDLAAEMVDLITSEWIGDTSPDLAVPPEALEHSISLLPGKLQNPVTFDSLVKQIGPGGE